MSSRAVDPRKTPQQARSRATVDRILEAAARVFSEEGYAATTDRIATAAHLSIGSLYQYFPNKDALVLELANRHLAESREALTQVLSPTRTASLWVPEVVAVMVDLHRDAPLHRLIYDQSPRTPELVAAFTATEEQAVLAVARLIEHEYAGVPAATERTARVLAALIEALTHRLVDVLPADLLRTEVTRAATAYLTDAMSAHRL